MLKNKINNKMQKYNFKIIVQKLIKLNNKVNQNQNYNLKKNLVDI